MSSPDPEHSPARPVLAASVAVFREGRVLVAQRGRAPNAGLFSLPGGRVEAGETLADAARREVLEETGLAVEIVGLADLAEVIHRDEEGRLTAHFVIAVFAARWLGGEAVPGEEAPVVRWVEPAAVPDLPATPGLAEAIARAAALIGRPPIDGPAGL